MGVCRLSHSLPPLPAQACIGDADSLNEAVHRADDTQRETRAACAAVVKDIRTSVVTVRDELFTCYQRHVSVMSSVEDCVAGACQALAAPLGEGEAVKDAAASLHTAVTASSGWPALSKFNAEVLRFSGEVSKALAARGGDVDEAQEGVRESVAALWRSVEGVHTLVSDRLDAQQQLHADTVRTFSDGVATMEAEFVATLSAKERTIADLRAQLQEVTAQQGKVVDEKIAQLKERFKAILIKQADAETRRRQESEEVIKVCERACV